MPHQLPHLWKVAMALAAATTGALLLASCAAPSSATPTPPSGLTPLPTGTPTPTGRVTPVGNRAGNQAPDFAVTNLNGQTVTLSGLLKEGKPFVLYFFATW